MSSYEHRSATDVLGIPILDEMLTDGYWTGASTLVAGPFGAGKTLDGPSFRLRRGTPGGTQPDRHVPGEPGATGVHLPGVRVVFRHDNVEVMYRTPVDVYMTSGSTTCWVSLNGPGRSG